MAYEARRAGGAPEWDALPVQYADFALWQLLDCSEGQAEFWRAELADLPGELELPYDRPRPVTPDHRGATVPFHWDAELHGRVAA
ncbi:hypothetical protein, partial [Streptomyces rimosus]|uniref:hypothetical protein n=1 Tax=Streptomyces rimosus TaxID=1927 RepID=UPI0019D6D158